MKWRSSIVLVVLAVAVGAFIFLYERKLPSTDEAARLADRIFEFEGDDVSWIEIESDGTLIRFERDEPEEEDGLETWRMAVPIEDRADRYLVSALADRLAALESERELGVEGALPSDEAAGLAPPAARISFDAGDGTVELLAGRGAPGTGAMFLRLPGEGRTLLVPNGLTEGFDRDPSEWRDQNLFDLTTLDLGEVAVTRPSGRLVFRRQAESWTLAEPIEDEARGAEVQGLLGALLGLRAVTFLEPDEIGEPSGLEAPTHSVRLLLRDGKDAGEIEFGAATGLDTENRYARVSGRAGVAAVPGGILERLDAQTATYRAMRLLSLREFEIRGLRFVSDAGTLSLSKVEGAWVALQPEGFGIDPIEVTRTLGLLVDLEAKNIVGPADGLATYGLDPPAARVEITSAGGADTTDEAKGVRTETLLFGSGLPAGEDTESEADEHLVHVMKEGRAWVLAAPAGELRSRMSPGTYRAPEPDEDAASTDGLPSGSADTDSSGGPAGVPPAG